jgi:hypothetical protein
LTLVHFQELRGICRLDPDLPELLRKAPEFSQQEWRLWELMSCRSMLEKARKRESARLVVSKLKRLACSARRRLSQSKEKFSRGFALFVTPLKGTHVVQGVQVDLGGVS